MALEANVSYRIPRLAYIRAKAGIGMDTDLNFPFGTDLLYVFPLIVRILYRIQETPFARKDPGAAEIGLGALPSRGGLFRFMVPIYLP